MSETDLRYLRIPLYQLLFRKGRDVTVRPSDVRELLDDRNEEDEKLIISAIEWAAIHPDYPFSSLLPDVTLSDEVIASYFVNLLDMIRRVK